jgi:hypothetical protein
MLLKLREKKVKKGQNKIDEGDEGELMWVNVENHILLWNFIKKN